MDILDGQAMGGHRHQRHARVVIAKVMERRHLSATDSGVTLLAFTLSTASCQALKHILTIYELLTAYL